MIHRDNEPAHDDGRLMVGGEDVPMECDGPGDDGRMMTEIDVELVDRNDVDIAGG